MKLQYSKIWSAKVERKTEFYRRGPETENAREPRRVE